MWKFSSKIIGVFFMLFLLNEKIFDEIDIFWHLSKITYKGCFSTYFYV